MSNQNEKIARLANEIIKAVGHDIDAAIKAHPPNVSIYPEGEKLNVHFDDYDDVWAEVSWDSFFSCIQAQTTEEESMQVITRMKEVIKRYEDWHGVTHEEWMATPKTSAP